MAEFPDPLNPPPEFPLCVCVPKPPEKECFTFPIGNIEFCTTPQSFRFESFEGLMMRGLADLRGLLTPLLPILIIISLVKALIDCINAIADSISQLSPSPMIDCLNRLAELFPTLFQLIPPFNWIQLLLTLVQFLDQLLEAIIDSIENLLDVDLSLELALLPDDDRLRCCLENNILAALEQLAAGIRAAGSVFLIVAALLQVLEGIPGLAKFVKPIRQTAEDMERVRAEEITPEFVEPLRDLQGNLRQIREILEGISGSSILRILRKANRCECDQPAPASPITLV